MSTTYRVMKIHDFGNSIFYRVACGCTDPDHEATLILEFDENDSKIMILTLYQRVVWGDWYYRGNKWFDKIISRIKTVFKILFKGWLELEGSMIFMDVEHIEAFICALQEGKNKLQLTK